MPDEEEHNQSFFHLLQLGGYLQFSTTVNEFDDTCDLLLITGLIIAKVVETTGDVTATELTILSIMSCELPGEAEWQPLGPGLDDILLLLKELHVGYKSQWKKKKEDLDKPSYPPFSCVAQLIYQYEVELSPIVHAEDQCCTADHSK